MATRSLLRRGKGRGSRLIAELAQETSLPGEWVGGSLLDCQVRNLVRVEAWSRPLAEALTLLHGHGNDTLAAIGTAFPVPTSLTDGDTSGLMRQPGPALPLLFSPPLSVAHTLSARLAGLGRYNHKVHGRPFILRCPNSPCQTRTRRELRIDLNEARAHPSPQNVPSCAAGVVLKSAQPICLEFKKARGSRPPVASRHQTSRVLPGPFQTPKLLSHPEHILDRLRV